MKKIVVFVILFFVIFLVLDYQSYYYGFGKGFLSEKIPKSANVKILFADSDLGYQGMVVKEDAIGGVYLIHTSKQFPIITYPYNHNSDTIYVFKVLGYYFNYNTFIVKILSYDNEIENIKITAKKYHKNPIYYAHFMEKIYQLDKEHLKYIDLDKSISYFQHFKLVKYLCLGVFIVLSVALVGKIVRNRTGSHKEQNKN